ncbi:efflux transporter outer membrane subunit [Solimicrobium silvestre]|uniref:Efflux transporter, outer membrane factor (OMF) lipoprotein, NodT family n=1 Tax=Solimicrobium silvestre TaxID=2099400 RepID=A0A2S9GU78_9BURK|nr:efflux transporter outer membrane subunit [Solimicrobium silvestre]PRC91263.1 Efflux transporter, outer membrane factor (OMF) lipoprotein, NodT family [Solimicrobium silvestre]
MFKRTWTLSILSVFAAALSACAVGPDYHQPKVEVPDTQAQSKQTAVASNWWRQFNDPVLNQLIDTGLQHNQDLIAAAARVEAAAAQAGIARSNLRPALDAGVGAQKGRTSQQINASDTPLVSDTRYGNLSVSWELDLWGKLRRSNEAANADFMANRFNRDAVALSLTAQLAQTYFQLRAFDAQLDIARRTLQSREESLALQTKRFKGGIISELDQRQAEAEAASARAVIPQIARSLEQTESALGVLLGHSPKQLVEGKLLRGQDINNLTLPLDIPAVLPSILLERRPDIAASEQLLIAANARIGAAKAAYFPSINLSGAFGSQSPSLDSLFTGPTRTWNFASNLAAPIFNFGATGYAVDAASANQKQALAQYQKSVQNAFKDALDAFNANSTARQIQAAQTTQLAALNKTLHLSSLRYDNGYSNYLDVLDAQRNSFQAELNLISAQLDRLNSTISVYKALGGGWESDTEEVAEAR